MSRINLKFWRDSKGKILGKSIPSTFGLLQVAWCPQFPDSLKSPPLVHEEIMVHISSGPRRYIAGVKWPIFPCSPSIDWISILCVAFASLWWNISQKRKSYCDTKLALTWLWLWEVHVCQFLDSNKFGRPQSGWFLIKEPNHQFLNRYWMQVFHKILKLGYDASFDRWDQAKDPICWFCIIEKIEIQAPKMQTAF